MCGRLINIEKERKSCDARNKIKQCLIDSEEDFNIYKTHNVKKKNIQTKSNKNKDDIIKQLNKKIGNIEMHGRK